MCEGKFIRSSDLWCPLVYKLDNQVKRDETLKGRYFTYLTISEWRLLSRQSHLASWSLPPCRKCRGRHPSLTPGPPPLPPHIPPCIKKKETLLRLRTRLRVFEGNGCGATSYLKLFCCLAGTRGVVRSRFHSNSWPAPGITTMIGRLLRVTFACWHPAQIFVIPLCLDCHWRKYAGQACMRSPPIHHV